MLFLRRCKRSPDLPDRRHLAPKVNAPRSFISRALLGTPQRVTLHRAADADALDSGGESWSSVSAGRQSPHQVERLADG